MPKKSFLRVRPGGVKDILFVVFLLLLVTCVSCGDNSKPAEQGKPTAVKTTRPVTKVSFPIDKCTFEKFVPPEGQEISGYSKALMYKLGTGVLKQKGGSLCKLQCPNGDSFPAWIDSDGKPSSALYGLSWIMNIVSYSPGSNKKPQLWEKRNGEWVELGGTFDDLTAPLPAGSKAPSAMYTVFSDDSLSDYSARLLRYFGIGIGGKESRVKLIVGNYTGTGTLSAMGQMRIENEPNWSEPME